MIGDGSYSEVSGDVFSHDSVYSVQVGVDVNSASVHLLQRVAGLNAARAKAWECITPYSKLVNSYASPALVLLVTNTSDSIVQTVRRAQGKSFWTVLAVRHRPGFRPSTPTCTATAAAGPGSCCAAGRRCGR